MGHYKANLRASSHAFRGAKQRDEILGQGRFAHLDRATAHSLSARSNISPPRRFADAFGWRRNPPVYDKDNPDVTMPA